MGKIVGYYKRTVLGAFIDSYLFLPNKGMVEANHTKKGRRRCEKHWYLSDVEEKNAMLIIFKINSFGKRSIEIKNPPSKEVKEFIEEAWEMDKGLKYIVEVLDKTFKEGSFEKIKKEEEVG